MDHLPSLSLPSAGVVLAVVRLGGRNVRLHPGLRRLLLPDGDEQPGCRVPPPAQRDHRRLRRGEAHAAILKTFILLNVCVYFFPAVIGSLAGWCQRRFLYP